MKIVRRKLSMTSLGIKRIGDSHRLFSPNHVIHNESFDANFNELVGAEEMKVRNFNLTSFERKLMAKNVIHTLGMKIKRFPHFRRVGCAFITFVCFEA